ncbi:MAG: FG-GAP-like repeat-containing protein, partial [Nitrospira sp.]|nr:FG-GAP-like repeat-containing protein [Nitrospira sp.]
GLVIPQAWSALGGQAGEEYGYCVAGIGDINGDGLADFAVGSRRFSGNWRNEGKVSVYYGSRAGPPWEPDWSAKGGQEDASFGESIAAAGDVNGDGIGDLLVGAFTWDGSQVDEGRAYLYLGSKDGPPGRPDWTAEGGALNARFGFSLATAGDVNRDGYADVIIGAFGFKSDLDGGRAFVFHGSPTGLGRSPAASFAARQGLASCGISVGTAGDVDRDGFADVVVGASAFDQSLPDEGKVWVLHGSPSGITAETAPHDSSISSLRFQTVPGLGTGPKPTALATGDFNRDGWPDLAAVSQGAHALHLFLGRGDGRFRAQPPVRIGKDPQALVVNDFNDDDIPDIATAAHSGTISVLLGDGHGGLQVANEYHVDLGPVGLAAADFDRDAIMDLAIVVEAGPDGRMLKGIGRGKFVEAGPITLRHEPHAAIAMDMDGDHQPDLVVANYNSSSVSVRRGRVGAELGERVDYRVGLTPKALASVDFNRDGRPDLVTANYAGETVTLLVGEADGSLRRADDFLVPGNPAAIVTADFDADGLSDLAGVL